MPRHYSNWINAFLDYSQFGEAPRHMYFWSGVSALAGALRRKVWIDQAYFRWYPNFYICLVAPPGIVSKSTTAAISMNLLKKVPGIRFGPDVVTWQALTSKFAESAETFEYAGEHHIMSPLTLESSEFGNLLNPQDKDMVDLLVSLWDGKQGSFEKHTKHSGKDVIQNPWINLIACTTPSWIAGNFPEYMIGGGFTSRCIFVYADKKNKYVAYPGLDVPATMRETEQKLIEDLEHISVNLAGEYKLAKDAILWGTRWYKQHYTGNIATELGDDRLGGYIARKQTHIHKLAMILAASESDDLIIREEHLQIANIMVSELEADMSKVFSKIGQTATSVYAERLIWYVRTRRVCALTEAYRHVHSSFPQMRDFQGIVDGAIAAGFLRKQLRGTATFLEAVPEEELQAKKEKMG